MYLGFLLFKFSMSNSVLICTYLIFDVFCMAFYQNPNQLNHTTFIERVTLVWITICDSLNPANII